MIIKKNAIDYILYDTTKYSKKKYQEMLKLLSINSSDFNEPALIYIKDGSLYSDIINIHDEKTVTDFINNYHIKNISNE